MGVVSLSKKAKMAYGMFSWLRKQLPNADVCTLRHVSVYVAMTNEELDIANDLNLIVSMDETMCNLLLSDGTEIRFENSSHRTLNFVVDKRNLDSHLTLIVSTDESDRLDTTRLLGRVESDGWSYVVGSTDDKNKVYFIKTYYKDNFVESGTSYFIPSINEDIHLDCIDGLGYLTDVMVKLDLLYNNVRSVNNSKLTRRKCV